MNKLLVTGAVMAVTGFSSQAMSTEAQIDALQNEILKIKQDMASDKSKAYFKKGKGLSIKSSDGKFSFEIKGRLMYDLSAITAGNDTVDNPSRADNIGTFGNEFRRARFTIKGEVGEDGASHSNLILLKQLLIMLVAQQPDQRVLMLRTL